MVMHEADRLDEYVRCFSGITTESDQPVLTKAGMISAHQRQHNVLDTAPNTAFDNISGTAQKFFEEGLTVPKVLAAAIRAPNLFVITPSRIESNIRAVTDYFKDDGLDAQTYIDAVFDKAPTMAYSAPLTIIRHINGFKAIYDNGLLNTGKSTPPIPGDYTPLFAFLMRNPNLLTLADENIVLRHVLAAVTESPTNISKLGATSKREIFNQLGKYIDGLTTLPDRPEDIPEQGLVADILKQRGNVLLGALADAGMLPDDLTDKINSKRGGLSAG